jgi:phospholipid transport system substrate-binding protein
MLTLTPMLTLNKQPIARRSFLLGLTSTMVVGPAFALDKARATQLVDRLVAEINRTINFGGSEAELVRAFENIFAQYADVNIIARSALGPAARSASSSELSAFILAFRGYIARKYGKRFQEFIGSEIVVKDTKKRGKFFEVDASVRLEGITPFEVSFRVSDRSGENLFFDIIIEGISLLSSERVEIGALLDARNGNIARLTRDLVNLG